MPNKSAGRKALRQSKKHAITNAVRKEKIRMAIKNVLKVTSAAEAKTLLSQVQQALDKAAKAGTIKFKTASRKLSRLSKKINKAVKK